MTTLMGADLNNIVKCQALSDEHVQFLVYQLLRGLKVGRVGSGVPSNALGWGKTGWSLGSTGLPSPAVYPLGRHHPQGRCSCGRGRGSDTTQAHSYHTHTRSTLQDLKPSNVAVNEDCELRVRRMGCEQWGCREK